MPLLRLQNSRTGTCFAPGESELCLAERRQWFRPLRGLEWRSVVPVRYMLGLGVLCCEGRSRRLLLLLLLRHVPIGNNKGQRMIQCEDEELINAYPCRNHGSRMRVSLR